MIWLAVIIPIAVAVFTGCVPGLRHRITWWEMTLPIVSGLAIIAAAYALGQSVSTSDIEYLGGWVARAEHYEAWNERVACTHTQYITDAKGNRVFAGYQHAYDVRSHPDVYQVVTSNGAVIDTPRGTIYDLFDKFGGKKFKDLHRSYHTNDGDLWYVLWPKDGLIPIEPSVEEHRYENRIQATTDSILAYPDVTAEEVDAYGLYAEYPKTWQGYKHHSALGAGAEADNLLNRWNAVYGDVKKVRVWLLYFNGSKYTRESGSMQERAWKGGNRNEVVVCVGTDDAGAVSWSHVFSWTDADICKIKVRDAAMGLGADPPALVNAVGEIVLDTYEPVDWDKYDYLSIETPIWVTVITYVVVLLMSGGLSWWSYTNQYDE